jgi:predicted RNA-binding Zn ribbon-like protein
MSTRDAGPRGFELIGQLLCLDLVNTEVRRDGAPLDLLPDREAVRAWLQVAGLGEAGRGARDLREDSPRARRIVRETVALRQALRQMAAALAAGRPVPGAALDAINRVLAFRPAVQRLQRDGDRVVSRVVPVAESPLHVLVPVAESAAWLLEHGDRSLVRKCESEACVRYFYDRTKNKRRRWCSMEGCGSRAKAAAYYRRTRAAVAAARADLPPRPKA